MKKGIETVWIILLVLIVTLVLFIILFVFVHGGFLQLKAINEPVLGGISNFTK